MGEDVLFLFNHRTISQLLPLFDYTTDTSTAETEVYFHVQNNARER